MDIIEFEVHVETNIAVGQTVAQRYTLTRLVGTGVGSRVFKAADILDEGRDVAIKVVTGQESRVLDSFFDREVASLSLLRHANIIRLLNHGITPDGMRWLALEWAEAGSLAEPRSRSRFRTEKGIVNLLTKCCSALVEAHLANIVHRDLKPANILFTIDNKPKVADFNVSKIVGRPMSTATTRHFFTDRYAAPEQLMGRTATEKCDVYALAVIGLELLVASNEAPIDKMQRMLDDARVNGSLTHLLKRMLRENPAERPTSPQVLDELMQLKQSYQTADPAVIRVTDRVISQLSEIHGPLYDIHRLTKILSADMGQTLRVDVRRSEPSTDEPMIVIVGNQFRYFLQPEESRPNSPDWLALNASILRVEDRMEEHRNAVSVPFSPQFIIRSGVAPNNNCVARLLNVVEQAKLDAKAETADERARADVIGRWETYLSIAREQKMAREQIGQVSSTHYDTARGLYRFDFIRSKAHRRALIDESVVYTPTAGRSVDVGHVVDETAASIVVRPHSTLPESTRFSAGGHLCLDLRRESASLDRQERALRIVRHNGATRPDLSDLLAHPGRIEAAVRMPTETIQALDPSNKSAVEFARGTDSFYLIQGPPGTGKTTVIAELVAQLKLHRRGFTKILVASQSHVAVDNALERLARLIPKLSAVRLGKGERIGAAGQPFELNHRLERFASDLRERAMSAQKAFESLLQVSIDDLEAALLMAKDASTDSATSFDDVRAIAAELISDVPTTQEALVVELEATILLRRISVDKAAQLRALQTGFIDSTLVPESFERQLLAGADVIAGTCLGFIANKSAAELTFDWVIVDEAARATAPELLVPLVRGRRLVLLGDHKQLPPILDDDVTKEVAERLNLDPRYLLTSLFEELFEGCSNANRIQLQRQYRMHPEIGDLISTTFYGGALLNGLSLVQRQEGNHYLAAALRWLDTSNLPDHGELKVGTSYSNPTEAKIVKDQLKTLNKALKGDGIVRSVGVLSAYAPQVDLLRTILEGTTETGWSNIELDILTVDAAQGREFDFVFYSTVRSNLQHRIGFLSDERRLNVALSRSREALTIIGDIQSLVAATTRFGSNPFIAVREYFRGSRNTRPILAVGRAQRA